MYSKHAPGYAKNYTINVDEPVGFALSRFK
jgi:hypothetical protein